MTLNLFYYGDTELWFASGNGWSLPLHLRWMHDKANDKHYGLITPACGLYYSQAVTLKVLLDVHDIQCKDGSWLVPRKMVEALLHKAPGITDSAYYQWPDEQMPLLPLQKEVKINDQPAKPTVDDLIQDPFVSHICKATGIQSSVVKVVLKTIAIEAPKWMLEKRRAVDLGFCRLIAAPFRSNWKEIVAFKYRKWRLIGLLNLHQKVKHQALEDAGLPEALCSVHNIGLLKKGDNHRIDYTIEAIPSKEFNKQCESIELARMSTGTTSYVTSFETTVESLYHHLVDALHCYLKKAREPFARVCERSNSGQLYLVPAQGHTVKVRGVGLNNLPTHIVSPDTNFSIKGGQSEQLLIQAQAALLPKMSNLLQAADDLREPEEQGNLDEQGQAGAGGLPMPDAGQSPASGKPMFPEPDGIGHGLDRN
jgi:hypothetical protein